MSTNRSSITEIEKTPVKIDSSLKPLMKFYFPTYAGTPVLEKVKTLLGPLSKDLKAEAVQDKNSRYLEKEIDPNLRTLYLSDWICSLQLSCNLCFTHPGIHHCGRFDVDFFTDGTAVIVLTIFADSSSTVTPKDVYDINTSIVSLIDHQDPKITTTLSLLISTIRSVCNQETDFLKVAKSVEMSHGSIYAGVCSVLDGSNLENDRCLLCQFLFPDLSGSGRVPKHIETDKFLAERIGDMVLHASWEGQIVHGKIDWSDIPLYDIVTRMNHHIWTTCFYLNRLASEYINRQTLKKGQDQIFDMASQYKQMAEIRTLRARFLAIKNAMSDFDSRLNVRTVELLKVSAAYGNMDQMLNSAAEKINFLAEDYTEQFRINEQLQNERLTERLQILALLVGTLGTVGVVSTLLQLAITPGVSTVYRVLYVVLGIVPAIFIGVLVWWFGLHHKKSAIRGKGVIAEGKSRKLVTFARKHNGNRNKVLQYYDEEHYSNNRVAGRLLKKSEVQDSWYLMMLTLLRRNSIEVSGKVAIELGCGLGFFSGKLDKMGAMVFATDISKTALHLGRKFVHELRGSDDLTWVITDAAHTPFRPSSFDLVVCAETLEHTFAISQVIREMARLVSPNGYVLVSFPNSIAWLPSDTMNKLLGRDQPEQLVNYYLIRQNLQKVGLVILDEEGADYLFEWGIKVPFFSTFVPKVGKRWSCWRNFFAGTTILLVKKTSSIPYKKNPQKDKAQFSGDNKWIHTAAI